jgi:hypothetical protein
VRTRGGVVDSMKGSRMASLLYPDDALAGSARQLAREVLIHGPISRSDLGQRLGLSPASLTRLSKPFLDHGLFVDGPENAERSVGRPAKPLDVRVDAQHFVGIKLTGDHALGVFTNLRADPLGTVEVPLPGHTPSQVVAAVRSVVEQLGGTHGLSALGITVGGKVTNSRVVERAPFLGWRDVDLGGLLSACRSPSRTMLSP